MKAATTALPQDLHDQLRWLAMDVGTTVGGLLRYGAMQVLQGCGERLPESVAHLQRVPFGGEVPSLRNQTEQEPIAVLFDEAVAATLQRIAEKRHVGVDQLVHDLVRDNLHTVPPGSFLN